jgi:hypothetical protein
MQIGYSESLINSLLSVLGTSPRQASRCSSNTVLDVDAEKVANGNTTFKQWADVFLFDQIDGGARVWTENSISGYYML